MIPVDKEIELAQAINRGSKKALDELTRANLRFVVSVAKQYQFKGLSLSDLINEGNLGLMKAAARFDETKGFKFISYAVWWIRQAIIHALSEQARLVRLPSNRVNMGNKAQQAISILEQIHERAPSVEELATEMQLPEADIQSIADYHISYVSLDSTNPVTGEGSLLDCLHDKEGKSTDEKLDHQQSLDIEIQRCLKTLPERERDIIRAFFGIGLSEPVSLSRIAARYDMTGERVRQIKDRAIGILRKSQKTKLLKQYL